MKNVVTAARRALARHADQHAWSRIEAVSTGSPSSDLVGELGQAPESAELRHYLSVQTSQVV